MKSLLLSRLFRARAEKRRPEPRFDDLLRSMSLRERADLPPWHEAG